MAAARSGVVAASAPVALVAQAIAALAVRERRSTTTGAPVADLGPADFIVREDNVAREVLRVAPASEPMQIALLVDNSQAAEPFIRDYRAGAAGVHRRDDRRRSGRHATRSRSSPRRAADHSAPTTPRTRPRSARACSGCSPCPAAAPTCSTASSKSARASRSASSPRAGHRRHHHRRPRVERPPLSAGARAAAGLGRRASRHRRRHAGRTTRTTGQIVLVTRHRGDRRPLRHHLRRARRSTARLKQVAAELTQSVSRHLRPAAVAHPARTRHGRADAEPG